MIFGKFIDQEILESGKNPDRKIIPNGLIGLSLSFCVGDIAEERVKAEEVKEIISDAGAISSEDWVSVLENYKRIYWPEYPDQAEAIFWELLKSGKIKQPRTITKQSQNIAGGHWIPSEALDEWVEFQIVNGHWSEETREAVKKIL